MKKEEARLARLSEASARQDNQTLVAETIDLVASMFEELPTGMGKVIVSAAKVARRLTADGQFRAALESAYARDRTEEALHHVVTIAWEVVRSATDDLRTTLEEVKEATATMGNNVDEHGTILKRIDPKADQALAFLKEENARDDSDDGHVHGLDELTIEWLASLAAWHDRDLLVELAGFDPTAAPDKRTRIEAARWDVEAIANDAQRSSLLRYLRALASFVPSPTERSKLQSLEERLRRVPR